MTHPEDLLPDYVDGSLAGTGLERARNATGLSFADEKAGYLAGYLSGLMAARRPSPAAGRPIVSVVGGKPTKPVMALIRGFGRGARTARPGIAVRVAYAKSFTEQEALTASPPLIDLLAADLPELLQKLDGRTVRRFDGSIHVAVVPKRHAAATLVGELYLHVVMRHHLQGIQS